MMDGATMERPELTLPDAEAARLREAYADAEVILEYGSGGSTVMAAEMPGKWVLSVESSEDWAKMMQVWFQQNPPSKGTKIEVLWSDIGPTKEWGYPTDLERHTRFARYPLAVWGMKRFRQPDVVLVDGRFRAGCALATAFNTQKPVPVFVDDYKRRKHYHRIESFLGAPRLHGRMAEFTVSPMALPQDRLLDVIEMMTRP